MRNQGSVVLIGGSGALGRELVDAFRKENFHVIIADIDRPDELPDGTFFFPLDATDPDSLNRFVAYLSDREIDLCHMVNTVGMLVESGLTNIFETSVEEIDQSFKVNLLSQLLPVKIIGEYMSGLAEKEEIAKDRSMTLTSSVNAGMGYSIPFYSAAKGGIESFIRPASIFLGGSKIRLNAVAPGTVKTPGTLTQPKNFEERAAAAALGKLCDVTEITQAYIMLAKMTGMTGQTVTVDAGQSINPAQSLFEQKRAGIIQPVPET